MPAISNTMPDHYPCELRQDIIYPNIGVRPPELHQYPLSTSPIRMLFIGWNPPVPFGGFWSVKFPDNLREALHETLKEFKEIKSERPDQEFLKEFLNKGFYFIHTVKCWTEAKYPGFGRGANTKEGREKRKKIGLPLLSACVQTHLAKELKKLSPQKVVALGELPFLGLAELYPKLSSTSATPTLGRTFQNSSSALPWPLLLTCFPQSAPIPIKGAKKRVSAKNLMKSHLRPFLSGE